jgi:hypothetical protein
MKYWSRRIGLGTFRVQGTKTALFASAERSTIGSWPSQKVQILYLKLHGQILFTIVTKLTFFSAYYV